MTMQVLYFAALLASCWTYVAANYCFTYHRGWSEWSACSTTCGHGSRTRTCSTDSTTAQELCTPTCLNGGQFFGGRCHCVPGTTGQCCTDIPECASNPCKNGGTCVEQINKYSCTCPVGTTQPNCDDIQDCARSPCQNGGTCHEHINYYTCDCVHGTTGHDCVDIPDCASSPCLNGGTCVEQIGGYTCQCPPGTTGHDCIDIPECISNPCQNGGTCNEMINQYTCTCTPRFAGKDCQKNLFSSYDYICHEGGSCYIVFDVKDTWQGAQEFCVARKGHLVVPDDSTEEQYLENYMSSMRVRYHDPIFWIGGTKSGTDSPHWVTGSQSRVYRWPSGVSDDVAGNQCLAMDGGYSFLWQAYPCDRKSHFICEERRPYTGFLVG